MKRCVLEVDAARRGVIAICVVAALSLGLSACGSTPSTSPTTSVSSASSLPRVETCAHTAVVRPASFVITCADANVYLTAIHWSEWQLSGASGSAIFWENSCTPTCVAGKFVHYAAKVVLSGIASTPSGGLFRHLLVSYVVGVKPASFSFALTT